MKFGKLALCLFLALVLLLTAVACGGAKKPDEPGKEGGSAGSTTSGNNDETATKAPNNTADLPDDLDLNNEEFIFHSIVQRYAAGEFEADMDGSVVNTAIYKRNDAIQEKYNCKITAEETVGNTNTAEMLEYGTQLMSDNTQERRILVTAGYRMAPLAIRGYLADLAAVDAIDLDKDYYSQGYNDALSVGNSQYLVTGKMTLSYYRYMLPLFFSRDMLSKANIEYPYQLVLDKAWTYEEMEKIVRQLYVDKTGDGLTDDDTYGYYLFTGKNSSETDAFMAACDLSVISKDESNYYVIDVDVNKFDSAISNVLNLLRSEGTYVTSETNNEKTMNKFVAGESGFMSMRMYCVEEKSMRDMGNSGKGYGILPVPMADAEQGRYVSYVQDQCFMFGIPSTVANETLQQMGQFFEAYAAESYNTVRPAYYERALTTRYVKDTDSRQMIEIIDSSTYMDPLNVYIGSAFSFNTTSIRSVYNWREEDVTITGLLYKYVVGTATEPSQLQRDVDKLNQKYQEILINGPVVETPEG